MLSSRTVVLLALLVIYNDKKFGEGQRQTYSRHNIRATSFYIPPRHVTTHELSSPVRATSGAFQSSRDPPPRAAGSDTSCTRLGRSRHPEKCCRAWLGLRLGLGLGI